MTNETTNNPAQKLLTGAIPTPQHILDEAKPYIADTSVDVPTSYLMWPVEMSYWGNHNIHGNCVTAEEAFAKASAGPKNFIPEKDVVNWAKINGFLNSAGLVNVLWAMQEGDGEYNTHGGFVLNADQYNDGYPEKLELGNYYDFKHAIYANGPVKAGVYATGFQARGVTPGKSGWCLYNYPKEKKETEYHCVSLCGYGKLDDLIKLFKDNGITVNAPDNMPKGMCYAMFTWKSIGIVDEQSLLNMTHEAWVRNPVTKVKKNITASSPLICSNKSIYWLGDIGNVNQLFYQENKWHYNNLSTIVESHLAATSSTLTCVKDQVYYFDKHGAVIQLIFSSGNWSTNNLTWDANSPIATTGSAVTCLCNQVYYLDQSRNIIQLIYTNRWSYNDLRQNAGAPVAAKDSALTCIQDQVFFLDESRNVIQLYYYENNWTNNDLTKNTGAPAAVKGSALTCIRDQVYFLDENGHVIQLYYYENNWTNNDLTKNTGAPAAAKGSALTCIQDQVYFLDENGHVIQLYYYENNWTNNDLTKNTDAPAAAKGSALTCECDSVYYLDQSGNVIQLYYYKNNWTNNNLTSG